MRSKHNFQEEDLELNLEPLDAFRVPVVDQASRTADDDSFCHRLAAQLFMATLQHGPHQGNALQGFAKPHVISQYASCKHCNVLCAIMCLLFNFP